MDFRGAVFIGRTPVHTARIINAMQMLRAFIAIELPQNIIACLKKVQDALKKDELDIRWVRPGNIHLTLKFLGDISVEMCKDLEAAIEAAATGFSPFELSVKGIGVFPGIKNARVVWAGVSGKTDTLFNFQRTLESHLSQKGIMAQKRPFKAHLTIGRIKKKIDPALLLSRIEACCNFETENFRVDRVVLFKSDLRPTGAVYTPLYQNRL